MSNFPTKTVSPSGDSTLDAISLLEAEIGRMEAELQAVEHALNSFEAQIRSRLQSQIIRLRELNTLYKRQKSAKKAKRLEQKKKGKNYKEPKGLKTTARDRAEGPACLGMDVQLELKRLYKEAIILVHPDKFVNQDEETALKANSLTVQLNALYKSGNLEELNLFHEHILSGNALSHVPYEPQTIANHESMLVFLRKKKEQLAHSLKQSKESTSYVVLSTYEDPLSFIEELRIQFAERISLLEKRTRKGEPASW